MDAFIISCTADNVKYFIKLEFRNAIFFQVYKFAVSQFGVCGYCFIGFGCRRHIFSLGDTKKPLKKKTSFLFSGLSIKSDL